MKNNNLKIIIAFLIALGIGLGAGYLIFGGKQVIHDMPVENHEGHVVQTSGEAEIWTCSMHPQIRQNEPGLCPICEMDLIPLEANTSNDPLVLQMTEEADEGRRGPNATARLVSAQNVVELAESSWR